MGKAEKKASPFVFINAVSEDRQEKRSPVDDGSLPVAAHSPFIANRALSLHKDSLPFAQEMNKRGGIDKRSHFNFLYFALNRRKRRTRWPKADKLMEGAEVVQEYYGFSKSNSAEIAAVIGKDGVEELRNRMVTQQKKEVS